MAPLDDVVVAVKVVPTKLEGGGCCCCENKLLLKEDGALDGVLNGESDWNIDGRLSFGK